MQQRRSVHFAWKGLRCSALRAGVIVGVSLLAALAVNAPRRLLRRRSCSRRGRAHAGAARRRAVQGRA
eukprot:3821694-Pleurochrysis_carterae.AAC.1